MSRKNSPAMKKQRRLLNRIQARENPPDKVEIHTPYTDKYGKTQYTSVLMRGIVARRAK